MYSLSIYPGKTEGLKEKVRSILAQFEFQYRIRQWEEKGVPFRTYLYVPETHPESNCGFCEREDEAHVLKVSSLYRSVMLCVIHTCTCFIYRELGTTLGQVVLKNSICSISKKHMMILRLL